MLCWLFNQHSSSTINFMKSIFIGLLLCCSCILQAQSNAIQQALKSFDYESALNLISKEKQTRVEKGFQQNTVRSLQPKSKLYP